MKNIVKTIDPTEVYDEMHLDKVLKKIAANPHAKIIMDDQYGDGSDHRVCPECGMCLDCEDCDQFGCGTSRSHFEPERDELIEVLSKSICDIEFVKVDGSIRKMTCTLLEEMIPMKNEASKPHAINTDTVKVFDLEKEGWRSFRIDSLKSIKVKE